jgi:hypothetical protein
MAILDNPFGRRTWALFQTLAACASRFNKGERFLLKVRRASTTIHDAGA